MREPENLNDPLTVEPSPTNLPTAIQTDAAPRPTSSFRALRHRNYQLFWFGSFFSNIGTWMQAVAQGWLVRELTASPTLIGFVAFASALPQIVFSLFSGATADLFNRRKLLVWTQVVQLICALALGLLVWLRDWQIWSVLSIWHVIAISFISGWATTMANPVYQTLTLDIVGRDDLPSALALNSANFNLSRIIGPTVGGLLFGLIGTAGCYFLNSASFLAVIVALLLMQFPLWKPPGERGARVVWRQMVAGLYYVRGRPRVLALLGMAAITSLFGFPYLTFMPVFARDVLGLDARGLAYLWAATGTGALISALVMAPLLSRERGRGRMLAMAMLLFGLVVTAFALSGQFIWSLLGLMLVGGGMVSVTITINALLQTLVRDEMRGRVMSLYSLAFLGVPPIGSLLIGAVAELLGGYGGWHGVQLAMALGGLVIVLLALLVIVAVPRLREME
jgi:MFS family permease